MASADIALHRRWNQLRRAQKHALQAALKREDGPSMDKLKEKIPEKVREKLEFAFCKSFNAVFEYGDAVIDKTINFNAHRSRFEKKEMDFLANGSYSSLSAIDRSGILSDSFNLLLTTVEGVGLGLLGVGIPDIVLFVAMLLRGVQEAALQYGRDPNTEQDKMLMLYMLEAAMCSGEDWVEKDKLIEQMFLYPHLIPDDPDIADEQLQKTAAAFATDLLVLKFIQGLPIVGFVGGLSNPVYYNKVIRYVRLKYERSYIRHAIKALEEE